MTTEPTVTHFHVGPAQDAPDCAGYWLRVPPPDSRHTEPSVRFFRLDADAQAFAEIHRALRSQASAWYRISMPPATP